MSLDDFSKNSELIEYINKDAWEGVYETVQCRRALAPSGLPGMRYALNPYGGCEHGCVYCYAPEVTHTPWASWRVVRVKVNVVQRLARELPGLSGTVGIGTVTDPYQGAEGRFLLTRRCLELLREKDFRVHIHTKSDLILRDLGLISSMEGEVGVTVTGVDDRVSKMSEPGAPLPARRLRAISELAGAGVDVYALVGPVLSHLEGREEEFCDAVLATGAERAVLDRLNERPLLSQRASRMGLRGSDAARERIRALLSGGGMRVEDAFRCQPRMPGPRLIGYIYIEVQNNPVPQSGNTNVREF